MKARHLAAAAAVLAAAAAAGAASATTPPKKVWVGTLQLSYFRHYELASPNGTAVEKDSRSVSITNKRNGSAFVTGRIRSTTAYPCSDGTSSGRIESWDVRGKVQPVAVVFTGNRYQIRYANPRKKVTIEELDCTGKRSRVVTVSAMNVGFQLNGRAKPGATRITGRWKRLAACTGSCVTHEWQGRWDLRLVTLVRG